MIHKFIFLDTNVFEQFQPIGSIDWLDLAKCTSATLLVPSVVLSELTEHKDSAGRERLRRRAGDAIRELRGYSQQMGIVEIRPGVSIVIRPKEPSIKFALHGLVETVKDDRLIAAAIEFESENKEHQGHVMIATGDFGLEMKASTYRQLSPLILPEALRIPEQTDEEIKKIRQLEAQVRQLQSRCPSLRLTFEDGANLNVLKLRRPQPVDTNLIKIKIEDLKAERPYLAAHPSPPSGWAFTLLDRDSVEKYNKKLANYYQQLEAYLLQRADLANWARLTGKIELVLINEGTEPGSNIEVDVHFPDGFQVLRKGELPEIPKEPEPPLTPDQQLKKSMFPDFGNLASSLNYLPPRIGPLVQPNVRLADVKKTKSYLAQFEVDSLMHTRTERLPVLYLHFESESEAKSFQLDYKIVGANVPQVVEGTMHVRVELGD
jgi:hypothetical protein